MTAVPRVDLDRFRLRRFVDQLQGLGEVETHAEPVDLADISAIIEASPDQSLYVAECDGEVLGMIARPLAQMLVHATTPLEDITFVLHTDGRSVNESTIRAALARANSNLAAYNFVSLQDAAARRRHQTGDGEIYIGMMPDTRLIPALPVI